LNNLTDKSESLASKMNKITSKLTDNLDLSEDMELCGDDIIESVESKIRSVDVFDSDSDPMDVINLTNMVNDFSFVRDSLKENTLNGRRVLNLITADLLDSEDENRASLIVSFAELNKAVCENMKLYMTAYKDISNILININKLKQNKPIDDKSIPDGDISIVSSIGLLKKLGE